MQLPQPQELLRHGVEAGEGQDVVIVVVAYESLIQAHREGPEAIGGDLLTESQRQAHKKEACGETLGMDASGLPEPVHIPQEVWIGKEQRLVGVTVGQGVANPKGWVRPWSHGEGRHVDVAGAISLHALHKGSP